MDSTGKSVWNRSIAAQEPEQSVVSRRKIRAGCKSSCRSIGTGNGNFSRKPWQARAKYKDVYGKWKEISKMLPEAKGKKEATRMAKEWLEKLNAEADLMPNAGKAKTVDEIYKEYLQHQLATGEIERSTYSNSLYSYNKYIKPYWGDYIFATVDKTVLSGWLTKLYQAGLSQNTIHTTYARLKKVYNYFYNNGELLKDPFKGVKMPKKGEAKVTHLNNDQCLFGL